MYNVLLLIVVHEGPQNENPSHAGLALLGKKIYSPKFKMAAVTLCQILFLTITQLVWHLEPSFWCLTIGFQGQGSNWDMLKYNLRFPCSGIQDGCHK